jgi:hypothetical protein
MYFEQIFEMEKVLEEFWGFKEFRGLQKNIIESVMINQATLALLPTGIGFGRDLFGNKPVDCIDERSSRRT